MTATEFCLFHAMLSTRTLWLHGFAFVLVFTSSHLLTSVRDNNTSPFGHIVQFPSSSFLLKLSKNCTNIMSVACGKSYTALCHFLAATRRYYADLNLQGDILLPCHLHARQHQAGGA